MKVLARLTVASLAALVGVLVHPVAHAPGAFAAYPIEIRSGCSTAAEVHGHSQALSASRRAPAGPLRATAGATVRVYVHVLRTKQDGGVTGTRIRKQIAVMNNAYAGRQSNDAAVSPFRFRIAAIDRTSNPRWFRMDEGTVAEGHAKRALHRGNADDLNLYIGMNRSGSLGWATQPGAYDRAPKMDGVVIRRTTMAGGMTGHYSSGDAAVHETGHWLGLLHTFTGRCGPRGDLVADTPREARPSYTCPTRRNTCTAPGRDPVHNFMDYSYDACMNQFTAGQVTRMRQLWWSYRAGGG